MARTEPYGERLRASLSKQAGRPLCSCVDMLGLPAGAADGRPPDGEEGANRRAATHQPQRASRHAHPKPLEVAALTISDAVLCSEMGVHFSPCGRLLAACVACQVSALTRQPGPPHSLVPHAEADVLLVAAPDCDSMVW